MTVNKSLIISSAIVFALAAPVAIADVDNNLVQLDLKKSSTNAVDVTLVTSESYGDNVLVRKKSDNKYVILIPQVRSAGYSASNLGGVRDLVSSVDVKTVDDTSGGYTKVTLITTKPLDIKTRTVKSRPITADQREYNTLIAQANAVKNTVSTQEPPKIRDQKTEVTVNKAPKQESVQPKKVEQQPKKAEKVKTESKVQKTSDIKLSSIVPEENGKQVKKSNLTRFLNEAKQEKALEEIPQAIPTDATAANKNIENTEYTEMSNNSLISRIKHKIKSGMTKVSHKMSFKHSKAFGIGILGLAALLLLFSRRRKQVPEVIEYTMPASDTAQTEQQPQQINTEEINDIADNNGLSWKEKYQLYMDKSAEPVARANNQGNYSFIKTPSKSAIEAKRQELERLISEEPSKMQDFEIIEDSNMYSEDSSIAKTIKFKAFENNLNSLNMSKRNRAKSRFKKYEVEIPMHEQKTVILDDSPLSTNKRNLKGANLEVSDVDKRRIKYQPKEYIMSSVDEYLNILDSEKSLNTSENQNSKRVSTNPIAMQKDDSFLKGTVVKSGFKISPDKGFYLINKDGKNSLIGKVNDKVTVIKNFDNNVTTPIQVRHDNNNVYMVKAGGYKSLVEVDDDKMGVLIEL